MGLLEGHVEGVIIEPVLIRFQERLKAFVADTEVLEGTTEKCFLGATHGIEIYSIVGQGGIIFPVLRRKPAIRSQPFRADQQAVARLG